MPLLHFLPKSMLPFRKPNAIVSSEFGVFGYGVLLAYVAHMYSMIVKGKCAICFVPDRSPAVSGEGQIIVAFQSASLISPGEGAAHRGRTAPLEPLESRFSSSQQQGLASQPDGFFRPGTRNISFTACKFPPKYICNSVLRADT